MISLRNGWTRLCEALGPSTNPELKPPAPPIYISGVKYSLSQQEAAALGLDDDNSFPSMSLPPRKIEHEKYDPYAATAATTTTTTTATTTTTTTATTATTTTSAPAAETTTATTTTTAAAAPLNQERPMGRFIDVAHSTMWCTYRTGFSPLARHNLTSDAGWGCMLRSGQMFLCNALMDHCLGQQWRMRTRLPPHDINKHFSIVTAVDRSFPDAEVARNVMRLFLDYPDSPFGIHRITLLGSQYGVRPGDWFAPTPISSVLRDLCMRFQPAGLRAYCARDGAIYTNEIMEMLGVNPETVSESATGTGVAARNRDDASIALSRATKQTPEAAAENINSFVVLVPVRLGITSISPTYFPQISALFRVPQFLGIVGGRPHSSLFFFASQGNELYYLNPHYVQEIVPLPKTIASLPIFSFIPSRIKKVRTSQLDPSMAFGFYFKNLADFNNFQREFSANPDINELFSVIDGSRDKTGFSGVDDRLVDI